MIKNNTKTKTNSLLFTKKPGGCDKKTDMRLDKLPKDLFVFNTKTNRS